ncbi:Ribosomal protein L7/L12 C-terminal domain-containing protein [Streptomyces zhaozhouensis]|uniref:Ribosomal protein L7/L12 C-terminal domain-containing protein n=1 Tax=Streptomyces zhaozhouensis TaxID=1300267 RepID=A0A286DWI7_9ACTN|nr:ribosomal protein L7/L12 [Streptomyces zhaozhouensis]SOD63047.1 Ribosomal protein L7/L12 C-terminal domain-containing protein [Streptomyces zhaozhouensis]
MYHRPHRDDFDRALARLAAGYWQIVDSERFASDIGTGGLLNPPSDLAAHFGPDGTQRADITLRYRGGVIPMLQSTLAREGLVACVPARRPEEDDVPDTDDAKWAAKYEATRHRLLAAENGTLAPEEGSVVCLATDSPSDLLRITQAFDRLAEHGYFAAPALWPTPSGCWEIVFAQTSDAHPRAVFWDTQSHDAFDARGDLVDELFVRWSGDRTLIADLLTDTGLEVTTPEHETIAFVLRPVGLITPSDKVDLILETAGERQLQVIKVLRELAPGLPVTEAKTQVRNTPTPILRNVTTWTAENATQRLRAAGATTTVKRFDAELPPGDVDQAHR